MTRTQFSDRLTLVDQPVPVASAVAIVAPPTDHIVVIDCSGSMGSDLPELRKQLKNKLPSLVKDGDTITIIWFSSRNQFGVLQEAVEVKSIADLQRLNEAIDRFLRPTGLTGFKQPLEEVAAVIDRIATKRSGSVFSLFFMSDGYDNQWTRREILDVTEKLGSKLASATFVEYGWGADRDLLSQMAEKVGGSLVFSQRFPDYEAHFEQSITRSPKGGKKTIVKLTDKATLGYAFAFDNTTGSVVTYSVNEDGEVLVPENTASVHYFSDSAGDRAATGEVTEDVYYGLVTLSQRMKANEIFDVLGGLGDVYLVNRFVNAFSKQDYIDFQNDCVAQAQDSVLRFRGGVDRNAVPQEDAYTVLDLLGHLCAMDGNLLHPLHEAFGYKRIGAGSEQKDDSVRFEYADREAGVPFGDVVFNANRPNASIRVKFEGSVNIPDEGREKFHKLPASLPTHIYRAYTIVRDGIVHTRQLPVTLTAETIELLAQHGVVDRNHCHPGQMFVMDISRLPVINRQMVKDVTAAQTFALAYELERLKGEQKVLKDFRDENAPKESVAYKMLYGEDAALYLKELGISESNGFNPPSTSTPIEDSYMAKFLSLKVKNLSSLPKVADVVAKIKAKKPLTAGDSVMAPAIQRVEAFQTSDFYTKAANPAAILKAWAESEAANAVQRTRALNVELAKTKFAIIVGHVWFSDLPAGEGSLTFTASDGNSVTVSAVLEEKELGGKD